LLGGLQICFSIFIKKQNEKDEQDPWV
jgi:hypothetical protein